MKRSYTIACLLVAAAFLGACGVKPSHVKAPEGAEDIVYPANYPSTDDAPE